MLIQYENLLKRNLDEGKNLPLNDFPLTCALSSLGNIIPHFNRGMIYSKLSILSEARWNVFNFGQPRQR